MKTEKLAHWAEIISSLVVVITLIFLINEVKRNTSALERQSEMDRVASVTAPFFEAPELASIMAKIKAVDGPDPLPQALVDRYGLTYVFRRMRPTYSDGRGPPIPIQEAHPFRRKRPTHSEG